MFFFLLFPRFFIYILNKENVCLVEVWNSYIRVRCDINCLNFNIINLITILVIILGCHNCITVF